MSWKQVDRFLAKIETYKDNGRSEEQNIKTITANFWSLVEMGELKAAEGTDAETERKDQESLLGRIIDEYLLSVRSAGK